MQRFRPGERLNYVLGLRDKAVEIVDSVGEWRPTTVHEKNVPVRGADYQDLSILFTTPFQKFDRRVHQPPAGKDDFKKYAQAVLLAGASDRPVDFILDIWTSSGKVLGVAWNDQGAVEIVAFKRGGWEAVLLNFTAA